MTELVGQVARVIDGWGREHSSIIHPLEARQLSRAAIEKVFDWLEELAAQSSYHVSYVSDVFLAAARNKALGRREMTKTTRRRMYDEEGRQIPQAVADALLDDLNWPHSWDGSWVIPDKRTDEQKQPGPHYVPIGGAGNGA